MHSNQAHSKTQKTHSKPQTTETAQARRAKVKPWQRTDKRAAWG